LQQDLEVGDPDGKTPYVINRMSDDQVGQPAKAHLMINVEIEGRSASTKRYGRPFMLTVGPDGFWQATVALGGHLGTFQPEE
jgi:hypothetical protein